MTGIALSLAGLHVRHPAASEGAAPALVDVGLQVAPGEQVVVIGPSGAGKTTLLHALACALPPMQGSLRVDGQDPWALGARELRRLRGRLFLAPQTPPLPPRQRVVTSVLAARLPAMGLGASLASLFRPRGAGDAHAALERFDLGDKLWERVDRLSGGERQRVGLARALLSPAALWLIDEPDIAIDAKAAGGRLEHIAHIRLKDQTPIAEGTVIHQTQGWVCGTLFEKLRIEVLDIDPAPVLAATSMIGGRDHGARLAGKIRHAPVPHARISKTDAALRNGHPRGRAPFFNQVGIGLDPVLRPVDRFGF